MMSSDEGEDDDSLNIPYVRLADAMFEEFGLVKMIQCEDWSAVEDKLTSKGRACKKRRLSLPPFFVNETRRSILHYACSKANVPAKVIELILDSYPGCGLFSPTYFDSDERGLRRCPMALQLAVRTHGIPIQIIKAYILKCPESFLIGVTGDDNVILHLCTNPSFSTDDIVQLVGSLPETAILQKNAKVFSKVSILHTIVTLGTNARKFIPNELIETIIKNFPNVCKLTANRENYRFLLHDAISTCLPATIIELIIKSNPRACSVLFRGSIPLHGLCNDDDPMRIIRAYQKAYRGAFEKRNFNGQIPLHTVNFYCEYNPEGQTSKVVDALVKIDRHQAYSIDDKDQSPASQYYAWLWKEMIENQYQCISSLDFFSNGSVSKTMLEILKSMIFVLRIEMFGNEEEPERFEKRVVDIYGKEIAKERLIIRHHRLFWHDYPRFVRLVLCLWSKYAKEPDSLGDYPLHFAAREHHPYDFDEFTLKRCADCNAYPIIGPFWWLTDAENLFLCDACNSRSNRDQEDKHLMLPGEDIAIIDCIHTFILFQYYSSLS